MSKFAILETCINLSRVESFQHRFDQFKKACHSSLQEELVAKNILTFNDSDLPTNTTASIFYALGEIGAVLERLLKLREKVSRVITTSTAEQLSVALDHILEVSDYLEKSEQESYASLHLSILLIDLYYFSIVSHQKYLSQEFLDTFEKLGLKHRNPHETK